MNNCFDLPAEIGALMRSDSATSLPGACQPAADAEDQKRSSCCHVEP